jgi:hypothetical protein
MKSLIVSFDDFSVSYISVILSTFKVIFFSIAISISGSKRC